MCTAGSCQLNWGLPQLQALGVWSEVVGMGVLCSCRAEWRAISSEPAAVRVAGQKASSCGTVLVAVALRGGAGRVYKTAAASETAPRQALM
jgi:hypothetical protein